MSRRSRRRNPTGERRWFGKAAVALLVLAVIGLASGYAVLRSYLHSDAFRKFLSAEAGEMVGLTGEFEPFQWEGLAVDTGSFSGNGEGIVSSVRADGLHTEIGLGGLGRGVWQVQGSRVRRLEVAVDTRKSPEEGKVETVRENSEKKKSARSSWYPREAELLGIDVGEVVAKAILESGEATASGIRIHAERTGTSGGYRAEVDGGVMRFPFEFIPELRLDHMQLRYQDHEVFLTRAKVDAWQTAHLTGTGEWNLKTKAYSVDGEATDIRCADLLNENWAKRLTGDVRSDFSLGNSRGYPSAKGKLQIQNGVITALPVLDALAAYADTRRFRELMLNEAHADWSWKKGEVGLSNLVISSEGLVRLEGEVIIRGKSIDGNFRLGLAPGTLARIPGAETDVFAAGERGLLWTPLRITGTLEDPKEDLTDRLIEAAGLRMFDQIPETGEKVIKFTRSVMGDHPSKTVEKGVKIIEESSKTVREVSGILDDLLGERHRDKKHKDKDEP